MQKNTSPTKRKITNRLAVSELKGHSSVSNLRPKAPRLSTHQQPLSETHYVLPLGNGWVIKGSKSAKFTAITDSKAEAISIARTMARTKHSHLVVHGKDGTIEIQENYTT